MIKWIFGTEEKPIIALGESNKECIKKIKDYYINREKAFIKHNKSVITEMLEFGADGEFESWIYNEAIDESEEAISDILSAKSMSALEKILKFNYDDGIKIVEEKFNTKKVGVKYD